MEPVAVLSMVPPASLMMPLLPPEFDIVMVAELERVPSLFSMPMPPVFDIMMVPELLMMPGEPLPKFSMPLPLIFDIVMVMVPVAVLSMVSVLKMPTLAVF